MSGDGDGWVVCAAGHRHWGRFGAAGLLISDGQRAILQHRAPWTHEGGTWALPGGARDSHEDPTSTALREAFEEAAIVAESVEPIAMSIEDHGGWSYTTVVGRPVGSIAPHAANAESTEVRWWDKTEIDSLSLHGGFASTWPRVRHDPPRLSIIVDTGADPRLAGLLDDRGATRDHLEALVRHGLAVATLPGPAADTQLSVLLARFTLVGVRDPGSGDAVSQTAEATGWWHRAVTLRSQIASVEAILAAAEPDERTIIVTADGALREKVTAVSASLSGQEPSWLLDHLDRHAAG